MFSIRQVLTNSSPGSKVEPSGIVTSSTKWARSQAAAVGVLGGGVGAPGGSGVPVAVGVGVTSGPPGVKVACKPPAAWVNCARLGRAAEVSNGPGPGGGGGGHG